MTTLRADLAAWCRPRAAAPRGVLLVHVVLFCFALGVPAGALWQALAGSS